MESILADVVRRFIEPELYHSRRWYAFGAILAVLLGAFGLTQTQWFVSLLPRPTVEAIREHIGTSRDRQIQISRTYHGPLFKKGVVFEGFSSQHQIDQLLAAEKSFVGDKDLENKIRSIYGVSFQQADIVVVPAWLLETRDSSMQLGITSEEGWDAARNGKGETDVGGFTIRDMKDNKEPKTFDGRPRVAINPNAFESIVTLRLVLFHEMVHAMNIPGYYPCRFTFAQNDLTYLPEYRDYVSRARLGGQRENMVWVLAVYLPWFASLLISSLWFKCHRSISRAS